MLSTLISGSVSVLFGTNLLSRTINTSLDVISGVLDFLRSGDVTNKLVQETKIKIEKMDIETKLELARYYVSLNNETDAKLCILLRNMNTILGEIEVRMTNIKNAIDNHSNKWFSYYRHFDVSNDLIELETHVSILDERLKKLVNFKE